MKRLNISSQSAFLNDATSHHVNTWPCSEHDIIALQDKFLTNGFQLISVPDIQTGRELIETFLSSLNCYHEIAALTMSSAQLNPDVSDLYQELVQRGHLDSFGLNDIENFFIDSFYFDFMWIEATKDLLAQPWFSQFVHTMCDFGIENHIPIVVLTNRK